MNMVDFKGEMGEYLLDPLRRIPKAHREAVCRPEQGAETCRYISLTPNGWVCVKKTPIRKMLDSQVSQGKMTAKGDNCEGLGKDSR
jgi:hypothetical protein